VALDLHENAEELHESHLKKAASGLERRIPPPKACKTPEELHA
jgi:hypothetical protein